MSPRHPKSGFTLLELLLVVAIIGILVAVMLPNTQPAIYDQLRSTAQIVATDLAYARSLAVANNDIYRIAFDLDANRYVLTHSPNGTNPTLDQLPKSPFSSPDDPSDQHIVDLADLPHAGPTVRLAAAAAATQSVTDVEFGPLGDTYQRADDTKIWLMAGSGADRRYITLVVNHVTGLTRVGDFSSDGPPSGVTQIQ